jgi:hypothetical protein
MYSGNVKKADKEFSRFPDGACLESTLPDHWFEVPPEIGDEADAGKCLEEAGRARRDDDVADRPNIGTGAGGHTGNGSARRLRTSGSQ